MFLYVGICIPPKSFLGGVYRHSRRCGRLTKLRELWLNNNPLIELPVSMSSLPTLAERRLAKFQQNVARIRLYRHRFLQENMRFAAFFKIYQIFKLKFLKFDKILHISRHLQFFAAFSRKSLIFQTDFLRKFWDCSGAKVCKSCRAWKMLSNAYFLAKFRFDTAEN